MQLLSPGRVRWGTVVKMERAMRITAYLLLITALHVSATGRGQTVTYAGRNVSLQEVFGVIKKQTGYVFFYKAGDLGEAKAVTVDWKGVTVGKALEGLLEGQPLEYSVQGNTVFVTYKA